MSEHNDAEWVKETVVARAFETGEVIRSGAWCADPVEGEDAVNVYRFEEKVER